MRYRGQGWGGDGSAGKGVDALVGELGWVPSPRMVAHN